MASTLQHKAWRLRELLRQQGLFKTLRAVWRRLRHGPAQWRQVDVLDHYGYAIPFVLKPMVGAPRRNSLVWFIPDFNIGSGGHLNIFRTIWHLEQMGYESTIVIPWPVMHNDAEDARNAICEHFFELKARVHIGLKDVPAAEFVIATGWDTAYAVRAYEGSANKVYFVQDYEPHFYPVGTDATLAENTYRFGFFGITAGDWLARKLTADYGMQTHSVGFGVELERYRRLPRREPEIRRVFFYARPPTPRRAFEMGLLVLNAVWERMPDTQFVLAGWDTSGYHIPFPHLSCGTVSLDDLPDLYSQCDVALVLSLTNASLLPLELMASGCNVVSNKGPNVEWLLNDEVAVLADPTPEGLAKAVCDLLGNDARRYAMSRRAEAFARAQTWDSVAQSFAQGLEHARLHGAEQPEVRCAA